MAGHYKEPGEQGYVKITQDIPATWIVSNTSTVCGTNNSWGIWNNQYCSGSTISITNSATDSQNAWGLWNQGYLASNSIITWHSWVLAGNRTKVNGSIYVGESEAEKKARFDAQKRYEEERRLRLEAEAKAKKLANALLEKFLDERQRKELREKDAFKLYVGEKVYLIKRGTHGNVKLIQERKNGTYEELTSYCIQPDGVPAEDAMLAQKLLLEANEKEFLRIANATQIRRAA